MEKAAAALGISYRWLRFGTGEMEISQPHEPGSDFVAIERVQLKISAGITGYTIEPYANDGPPIFFRRDRLDSRGFKADQLSALKVSGASMEPGLYDGDLVVVNRADTTPTDGDVFAVNYEGQAVIKRLKRDRGEWFLTSDNEDKRRFGDKVCDENAIILGRVIYKQSERI